MNTKINKSELDAIGRALRANVKAAKAAIIALGPKLKAEFEVQLRLLIRRAVIPYGRRLFRMCMTPMRFNKRVLRRVARN